MRTMWMLALSGSGITLLCGCEILRMIAGTGTPEGALAGAGEAAARGAGLTEIALYALIGWFGGRTTEAGGKAIVNRVRNGVGRKQD